ncbi:putative ribonuclease H-like domain-containing protein [Tanacetum coccineum]
MFDIDYLTDSMNYIPISLENQANPHASTLAVNNSAAVKNTAKKASSTGSLEGTPKILAFRRELEAIAQKHLGTVPENNTSSVNSGSEPINTGELDPDDSAMPELEIFHTSEIGIFMRLHMMKREEGIDYDKVFAPVARIEAIRLFLAFASFIGFIVYQMDVKSVFLYGTIDEEVYVSQPPGFVDPDHLKKVYKVVKALYGLHQAHRAWYATLSTFLEEHGYRRGTIDKTLFIKKDKKDFMLMSSMGELTFFLGLQVKQNKEGIFISQDKYVAKILMKFDLVNVKAAITPMETKVALTKDEEAIDVDVHLPRLITGGEHWHGMDVQMKGRRDKTATANTIADGTLEIHATIDTIGYTIIEASIRDKLQLADATGNTMLPNDADF